MTDYNEDQRAEFLHKYYVELITGTNLPQRLELNTIHHGDAFDLIKLIPSNSVKLILLDPPYFMGLTHNGQRGNFVDLAIAKPFYKELFSQCARILNENGEIYVFTDWRAYAFYYPLMEAFLGVRNTIVWDKGSGAGNFYTFNYEMIMFSSVRADIAKKGSNIWRSPGFASGAKATNGEKVHPTQKTLEIVEKIVLEGSQPGDTVFDGFGGSGTTGVVCRKKRRNFIIFELDEENIDIAHKRQNQNFQPVLFDADPPPADLQPTQQPLYINQDKI